MILSGFCPEIKYSSHLMFVLSLSLERMQEPWIFHLLPTNNLEYFFPQLNKLFADFTIKLSFCHRVFKHFIYITFDCYHLDIHFISVTNENENGKYKLLCHSLLKCCSSSNISNVYVSMLCMVINYIFIFYILCRNEAVSR